MNGQGAGVQCGIVHGFDKMRIFGISGWSGMGKTTLIEALIPLFTARGLKVSMIKSAHHDVDIDKPGKDSFRFREAGAMQVILASGRRWALMSELRDDPPPTLEELVGHLSPCDLVLVEGYKAVGLPKLEVFRPSLGKPFVHADHPGVVAIASDAPIPAEIVLPIMDLNDPPTIAEFILHRTGLA
jgi:molybdopterin-guanine dinucleotide biosynthesis adapter protein